MELKHLRTLQAVVDQGSFQRAAEHLGYTQSTVTVQIQQLEASIGVPLFQKAGRRMVLTETGMAILPQVRAILAASDVFWKPGGPGRPCRGLCGWIWPKRCSVIGCSRLSGLSGNKRHRYG